MDKVKALLKETSEEKRKKLLKEIPAEEKKALLQFLYGLQRGARNIDL